MHPLNLNTLFDNEISEITKLLRPGQRKHIEADARIRALTILDTAITGETAQPSFQEIHRRGRELIEGKSWQDIFPGVASLNITADGTGHKFSLYIVKKEEGLPVYIVKEGQVLSTNVVPEGTPGAPIVLKQIHDWDQYSMGLHQLAKVVGLTPYQARAVIWHTQIKDKPDCYKEFKRGTLLVKAYSQNTIATIRHAMSETPIEIICDEFKQINRDRQKGKK